MRISDDRYNRDRLRFDLALRMMRLGARTRTVCECTGLTEDRLRKLCRAYDIQRTARPTYRLRAKPPQHASCFLKSSSLGFEASTLASLFSILGLLSIDSRTERPIKGLSALHRGQILCEAYEAYLSIYPPARLSLEHACFLLDALTRRNEIKASICGRCGRLHLTDPARIEMSGCGCSVKRLKLPRRRKAGPAKAAQLSVEP